MLHTFPCAGTRSCANVTIVFCSVPRLQGSPSSQFEAVRSPVACLPWGVTNMPSCGAPRGRNILLLTRVRSIGTGVPNGHVFGFLTSAANTR
eukprot:2944709-Prymnesium_polylepis.4